MTASLRSDSDVYCWLRITLSPRYQVLAEPQSGYYSESYFRYLIMDGNECIAELSGDFREIAPGALMQQARDIVQVLMESGGSKPGEPAAVGAAVDNGFRPEPRLRREAAMQGIIASRLPPKHGDWTYFCSGRAAFAFLLKQVVRPQRVWLPSFVCWSLVSTVQQRFPQIELLFYRVDRNLQCDYPSELEAGDALVVIHYFGKFSPPPFVPNGVAVLEDISHVLSFTRPHFGDYVFGSLRKTFRIADGGQLKGFWNPVYESSGLLASWLRHEACDWRDLREAENMMDRDWTMADMSSQSVAAMMLSDVTDAAVRRRTNNSILTEHFPGGSVLQSFDDDETPLLHNRLLSNPQQRDSLKQLLASHGIFCSIHWPAHPVLRQLADKKLVTDAIWLEQHVLSIPISEDLDATQMRRICAVAREWRPQ